MGYGFCSCGCGNRTVVPIRSDTQKKWVKGVPLLWLKGHNLIQMGLSQTKNAIGNKGISSHGYVRVRTGKDLREYEHILVAETILGRRLKTYGRGNPNTEVVHHIDGNKKNNSPENLLICTHKYHTELHHRLEISEMWPEYRKVIRNSKRG